MDNNTTDAKQVEYEIYAFAGNNILRQTTSDIIKYLDKQEHKEHKEHKEHNISLNNKLIYFIMLVILVIVIYNFLFF